MLSRRDFIKTAVFGAGFLALNCSALGNILSKDIKKITILHTNDTHSHIEPFPNNDPKYPGLGGAARRAALIKKIRAEEKNVLLFDAGDVYQGSPYFNFYGGEIEFKLMSEIKYDAMTLGNHEFDNGLDGIASKLQFLNFPIISSNYDFNNTILNGKFLEYKVFNVDDVKIGVFGLTVDPKGLIDPEKYKGAVFHNPYEKAAYYSYFLKNEMKCDIIICLSHLGFDSDGNKACDINLAKQSKNIDLIIGGHTHTFLDKPCIFKNSDEKDVMVVQVGWAGIKLGKVDFFVIKETNFKYANFNSIKIDKKVC